MFIEPNISGERRGSIEVICGSMFSGKTEELIRRLKRVKIANLKVEIFKPAIDVRYDEIKIVSHDASAIPSTPIDNSQKILLMAGDADVIGIDEAQFFDPEIVQIVQQLASRGIRVLAAGLDTDFRGEPFGPMPILMSIAEHVDKLHAICMVCGDEASRTQRLVNGKPARFDDPVVIVGASEMYEARCRVHHEVPR